MHLAPLCYANGKYCLLVCVGCSYAQEGAYDRLFRQLMTGYEKSIIPGSPTEAVTVAFKLTVLCAEIDSSGGQLTTNAWQFIVR